MSELSIIRHKDGVVYWGMDQITVDGVYGNRRADIHGSYFFNFRDDMTEQEERSTDEYLDESKILIYWSSPHAIWPETSYNYGEIDEELWLKMGYIVAVDSPDYKEFRRILESS